MTPLVALCLVKLPFVDEAPRDPSLIAFRKTLVAAVRKGNWKWVDFRVDPSIRYSFGENNGKRGFLRQWGDNRQGLSKELLAALNLGGSFIEGSFWAPYVHSTWPESADAFSFLAVITKDVPLMSDDNKQVALLDHDLVESTGEEKPGFIHVKVDEQRGWVARDKVRSPLEFRAALTKVKGSWRITAFVAGD